MADNNNKDENKKRNKISFWFNAAVTAVDTILHILSSK